MRTIKKLLIVLMLTLPLAVVADYLFKTLDARDGLTSSQVNCILKDSRGYVWFGTPAGLYRFDGYTGKRNLYIYDINEGEYIKLRGVDFAKGAKRFMMTAASTGGVTVTLRLDSDKGPAIGSVIIGKTGSIEVYRSFSGIVKNAVGVHDLYICFDKVSGDVRLDWWQFK